MAKSVEELRFSFFNPHGIRRYLAVRSSFLSLSLIDFPVNRKCLFCGFVPAEIACPAAAGFY